MDCIQRLCYPFQEFLGYYEFKSKTHVDEFSPEGRCKAAMFTLLVEEVLSSWPEQDTRHQRQWVSMTEAAEQLQSRHAWMKEALEVFSKWHAGKDDDDDDNDAELP